MLVESLNYLSFFSIENNVKSLMFEEYTTTTTTKKRGKGKIVRYYRET